MLEDFGEVSEDAMEKMERQLLDYFGRKLGHDLIAFVARSEGRIISVVLLHVVEMPANVSLLNGKYGVVLNVYTEENFRRRGICMTLMKNLLAYAKEKQIGRIDLSATKAGFPLYKKLGFVERNMGHTEMRYTF